LQGEGGDDGTSATIRKRYAERIMKRPFARWLPGNYPNDSDGPTGAGLVQVYHLPKTLQRAGAEFIGKNFGIRGVNDVRRAARRLPALRRQGFSRRHGLMIIESSSC
jgi:hypothetical protein